MANAVTQLTWYGASPTEPAGLNAEDNAGIVFNREDSKAGTNVQSGVPIPVAASTFYSWPKLVALDVLTPGTTNISNRRIALAGPMPVGLHWYAQATTGYFDPSAATTPADNTTTDAAVPAGFTEVTYTSSFTYDASVISTASAGRNGAFCQCVGGIDSQYAAGGGGSGNIALPTYRLSYDQA